MWNFVQLSNPSLGGRAGSLGNDDAVSTLMPEVITSLREDLREIGPDFILATGDIVSEQSRDSMFAARDLLDSLGVPYYPMGGNSDFIHRQSRNWFLEAFQAQLPVRDTVYSFTHKDLHICVLDPWWEWPDGSLCPFVEGTEGSRSWAIPPHQFEWLEHDLREHDTCPTIVAMHFPPCRLPDRVRKAGVAERGHLANGPLLVKVLRRHSHVKALFTGHARVNCIVRDGDLTYIMTAALPEYPNEYRVVRVRDNCLEVETLGLGDASLSVRSLAADSEWSAGDECDRKTVIPLG